MKRKIFLVELSEGKITEKTDRYGKDQKIPLTLESPPKAPQPQFPEKEGSVTDQKLFWNNSRQYLEAAMGAWAGVGSYPARQIPFSFCSETDSVSFKLVKTCQNQ